MSKVPTPYCQHKRDTALARAQETGILHIPADAERQWSNDLLDYEPDWTGPYFDFCHERRLVACIIAGREEDSRIEIDLKPAQRRLTERGEMLIRDEVYATAGLVNVDESRAEFKVTGLERKHRNHVAHRLLRIAATHSLPTEANS
jgi:hypothetical protein